MFFSYEIEKSHLDEHFRNETLRLETLKGLMVKNGDERSEVFYLKVIIKGGFVHGWIFLLVDFFWV